MIRRSIRLTFGAKAQPGITLQRGDCFSTAICAQCYAPNGCPVSFEGRTVHVAYQTGGQSSPGYEVEARDNVLTWTLPPCAAQTAGPGKMQLMVYGADSLLHSAVIPYTVLDSLEPGEGGEDPVPALVLLLDKAQAAISGANAAAQAAAQVAAEVQSRLDSGAFIGPPGLDAPQIDDAQITTTNPWSSMQIVNILCPPFTVSGSVVQCYPVANYPLGVKVAWEPHQEGEGDPSPDNIRPITGMDEVQVTRAGKNLIPITADETQTTNGVTWTVSDGVIHAQGTASPTSRYVAATNIFLPKGTYAVNPAENIFYELVTGNTVVVQTKTSFTLESDFIGKLHFYVLKGTTADTDIYPQIELGSTPTAYEPYQPGTTATLTLPETIYGGTVDAVTGEGSEEVHGVQFNGTEAWIQTTASSTGLSYFEYRFPDSTDLLPSSATSIALARQSQKISHFKIGNPYSENVDDAGWVYNTASAEAAIARIRASRFENVEEWKSYLAAQYAAGTPVTIAYKLATPQPIQATGGQSIPALPGTNTVYTDADTVTVSGLSDPVSTIASLQARVSALESAQTNM